MRKTKTHCIRNGCKAKANSDWICEEHAKEREELARQFYEGKPTQLQQRAEVLRSMRTLHKPGR